MCQLRRNETEGAKIITSPAADQKKEEMEYSVDPVAWGRGAVIADQSWGSRRQS